MSSFVKFLSLSLAHFFIGHLIHVWMSLGLNKPIYLDPRGGTELQMVSLSYDYISTHPKGWSCFVVESFLIVSAIFLCPGLKITSPERPKVLKLNPFSLPIQPKLLSVSLHRFCIWDSFTVSSHPQFLKVPKVHSCLPTTATFQLHFKSCLQDQSIESLSALSHSPTSA